MVPKPFYRPLCVKEDMFARCQKQPQGDGCYYGQRGIIMVSCLPKTTGDRYLRNWDVMVCAGWKWRLKQHKSAKYY